MAGIPDETRHSCRVSLPWYEAPCTEYAALLAALGQHTPLARLISFCSAFNADYLIVLRARRSMVLNNVAIGKVWRVQRVYIQHGHSEPMTPSSSLA